MQKYKNTPIYKGSYTTVIVCYRFAMYIYVIHQW